MLIISGTVMENVMSSRVTAGPWSASLHCSQLARRRAASPACTVLPPATVERMLRRRGCSASKRPISSPRNQPPAAADRKLLVSPHQMASYFQLLDDAVIAAFLERDVCRRYGDRYLLAMVFTYFVRARFGWRQYTRNNFFVALFLAHDMEEDEEDYKFEILPWLYGDSWRRRVATLHRQRDALWRLIEYRAVVSRKCCDEVISIQPDNACWSRHRRLEHSGAFREYSAPSVWLVRRGWSRENIKDMMTGDASDASVRTVPTALPRFVESVPLLNTTHQTTLESSRRLRKCTATT